MNSMNLVWYIVATTRFQTGIHSVSEAGTHIDNFANPQMDFESALGFSGVDVTTIVLLQVFWRTCRDATKNENDVNV